MAEGDGNFSKKIEIDTFKYVLNMSFRKIKATVVKKNFFQLFPLWIRHECVTCESLFTYSTV